MADGSDSILNLDYIKFARKGSSFRVLLSTVFQKLSLYAIVPCSLVKFGTHHCYSGLFVIDDFQLFNCVRLIEVFHNINILLRKYKWLWYDYDNDIIMYKWEMRNIRLCLLSITLCSIWLRVFWYKPTDFCLLNLKSGFTKNHISDPVVAKSVIACLLWILS